MPHITYIPLTSDQLADLSWLLARESGRLPASLQGVGKFLSTVPLPPLPRPPETEGEGFINAEGQWQLYER